MKTTKSILLAESGIMLAFATLLSMIAIINLPYGGSVTAFSMLPIILVAYRRGVKWGLFTALAFGLLQMLLGLNNLSYATSQWAAAAIILIDYIAAFTVLGFGGVFRKFYKSQAGGLAAGTLLVCALRYIAHVITGCTVWAGVSIPEADGFIYSIIYNATYMLPETLVTVVGAVTLSRLIDIRGESITRVVPQAKAPDLALLLSGIGKAALAAGGIADIALVFSKIQNPDSGEFDITQISSVNWKLFISISMISAIIAILAFLLAERVPRDSAVKLDKLFFALPFLAIAAAVIFVVYYITLELKNKALDTDAIVKIIIAALAVAAFAAVLIRRMKKR